MLTNFETNKVFIAKGLSSVPYSSTEYSLVTTLYNQNVAWGELPYSESPFHIWARDYMPVQVNNDKFVKFNAEFKLIMHDIKNIQDVTL